MISADISDYLSGLSVAERTITAYATTPGMQLALPGVALTPTSATISGPVTVERAGQLVTGLDAASTSLNWWLGDITIALLRQVSDGDRAIADLMPADQPNTARCVLVASKIAPERRRPELTWSHHHEVASMPAEQQDRLLAVAVANGLSVRGLRAVIDQERADLNPELELEAPVPLPRPPASQLRAILDSDPESWVLWHPASGTVKKAAAA